MEAEPTHPPSLFYYILFHIMYLSLCFICALTLRPPTRADSDSDRFKLKRCFLKKDLFYLSNISAAEYKKKKIKEGGRVCLMRRVCAVSWCTCAEESPRGFLAQRGCLCRQETTNLMSSDVKVDTDRDGETERSHVHSHGCRLPPWSSWMWRKSSYYARARTHTQRGPPLV